MKRNIYMKPEIELVLMSNFMEGEMREGSWGVDGGHTPIKDTDEGDEIIIYGKDGSNMWDGWED